MKRMKSDLYSHVFGLNGTSSNSVIAETQYVMRYAVLAGLALALVVLVIGLIATNYFGVSDQKIVLTLLVGIAVFLWPVNKTIVFFARRSIKAGKATNVSF